MAEFHWLAPCSKGSSGPSETPRHHI